MEEIEKNDFSLNISRYVHTSEMEEAIDLKAVHKELVLFDRAIDKATKKHNAFLSQLGLPPLP